MTPKNNRRQLLATHLARTQHLRTLLNGATYRKAHFPWVATDGNNFASLKAPWPTAVAKQRPLSHGCHACCCWPSCHDPCAVAGPTIMVRAVQICRRCVLVCSSDALHRPLGSKIQLHGPTRYLLNKLERTALESLVIMAMILDEGPD